MFIRLFNLIFQIALNENERLSNWRMLEFEPCATFRVVVDFLGEVVHPFALRHVDASSSKPFLEDWSHHEIATEHELVLDLLDVRVGLELDEEGSKWCNASLLIFSHKIELVILE